MSGQTLILAGDCRTQDPLRPRAGAIGILDGKVACAGSRAEVAAVLPRARIVQTDGIIIPGFVDCHLHALWLGRRESRLDTDDAGSLTEVLARIRAAARSQPADAWLLGSGGFNETAFPEGRLPTLKELDDASGGRPLLLDRRAHDGLANSAALRAAGVYAASPDPEGGCIHRDGSGTPTGLLVERAAVDLVERAAPEPTVSVRAGWIRAAHERLLAAGITSVADPALTPADIAAYLELYGSGGLRVRTTAFPLGGDGIDPEDLEQQVLATGILTADPAWLRLGPVKIFLDGGGGLGTALRHDCWPGTASHGVQATRTQTLRDYVSWAAASGRGLAVHAVGPAAVDLALNVLAEPGIRWMSGQIHLIHAYLEQRPESMARAAALNVALASQPALHRAVAPMVRQRLGAQAAESIGRLARWQAAGVLVGGGSDAPGPRIEPLAGIEEAASDVGRTAALALFTRDSAQLLGSDAGILRPGAPADLVVLRIDPETAVLPESAGSETGNIAAVYSAGRLVG